MSSPSDHPAAAGVEPATIGHRVRIVAHGLPAVKPFRPHLGLPLVQRVDRPVREREGQSRPVRAIRRAAKDTKHGINMAAKKARTNIRLSAAAAELPAGRGARVVYRANQVNDLANAAVGIATAVVAMQQAYRQLRTTPMSTPGSTNEYNPQEDPPF